MYRLTPLQILIGTTLMFSLLAIVGGEALDLYEKLPWWDVFLHFKSGWFASLVVSYFLLRYTNLRHPAGLSLIAVSVAMNMGAQWEIFEYMADQTLGWNMQKSGLEDTMTDLVADSAGAVTGAIAGYRICAGKTSGFITNRLNRMIGA